MERYWYEDCKTSSPLNRRLLIIICYQAVGFEMLYQESKGRSMAKDTATEKSKVGCPFNPLHQLLLMT
jgi:hypothetical protein